MMNWKKIFLVLVRGAQNFAQFELEKVGFVSVKNIRWFVVDL